MSSQDTWVGGRQVVVGAVVVAVGVAVAVAVGVAVAVAVADAVGCSLGFAASVVPLFYREGVD